MTAIERQILHNEIMDKCKVYISQEICDDKTRGAMYRVMFIACGIVACIHAEDPTKEKHGYNANSYPSLFKCSVCGWEDWDTYSGDTDIFNYCPNCGASMDEVKR